MVKFHPFFLLSAVSPAAIKIYDDYQKTPHSPPLPLENIRPNPRPAGRHAINSAKPQTCAKPPPLHRHPRRPAVRKTPPGTY
jgi:hypothetical protein